MVYKTKALTLTVLPNDIIEIATNEDWTGADTLEIAKENIVAIKKAIDGKPRAFLSLNPNTHMSREVLKYYSEVDVGEVATAMLIDSFAAKLVGNIFLKIASKAKKSAPIRIFSLKEREIAIEWLLGCITKAKKMQN